MYTYQDNSQFQLQLLTELTEKSSFGVFHITSNSQHSRPTFITLRRGRAVHQAKLSIFSFRRKVDISVFNTVVVYFIFSLQSLFLSTLPLLPFTFDLKIQSLYLKDT